MKNILLLFAILLICSCTEETANPTIDWNVLKIGLINKNRTVVESEMSKLLVQTNPKPTNKDIIGQKDNLQNLISEINKSEVLGAELVCYACIETYPPQSEIEITADSSGVSVTRVIDILTPENSVLKFAGMHE